MLSAAAPIGAAAATTYKLGDVNKSGSVNTTDARIVLRSTVKLETLDAEQQKLADADLNGKVEEADARLILRSVVGLEKLHSHTYGKWQQTDKSGKATDYHYQYCSCGEMKQAKHTFETVVIREGTCTQTGLAYSQCTVCGYAKSPVTTSVKHDYQVVSTVPETCTADGRINKECKLCGYKETEIITKRHIPGAAATCTDAQKCTRCGEILVPELGHIYPSKIDIQLTTGIRCSRCDKVIISSFNTLVNKLKDGTHRFTEIDKNISTFKEPTYTGLMLLLKGQFDKEFKDQIGTTTEYSPMITNRLLTVNNFNLLNKEVVSELQTSDIKSITTEKMTGVDFIKTLPDSFNDTSGKSYDLTSYKKASIGSVLKVTVTTKTEKYSECKDKGGSVHIEKIYSGYGELLNYTFDGLSGADFDGFMKAEGDAVSNATVVYYFDAQSLAPIAASYKVSMDMDESMNIYIQDTDDGDVEITKDPTGSVKMKIINDMYSYCLFDSYFG